MVGFKSFLSAKSFRRSHDDDRAKSELKNSMSKDVGGSAGISSNSIAQKSDDKHKESTRLIAGFQKVFGNHRRGDHVSLMPSAPATPTSTPKRLYRFQSPKQNKQTSSTPSSLSTADNTTRESDATMLSHVVLTSTPPTSPLTPLGSAHSATSAPNNNHTDVAHVTPLAKFSINTARPITQISVESDLRSDNEKYSDDGPVLRTTSHPATVDDTNAAIEGMRVAEQLLNQRHATIKPQANTSKRVKPLDTVGKNVGSRDSHGIALLPSSLSALNHRQTHLRTANQAIEAARRRQAVRYLAFYAADGCPTNIDIIDRINAHFHLEARHIDGEIPNATFDVNGVLIRASQMPKGSVERNWIIRYNAVVNNAELVERRLMNSEDHEMIVAQLFPEKRGHILNPEHFEIFMTGLGEEGILTKAQAKSIAIVAVSKEEFDKGIHYVEATGSKHAHRRNTTAAAMFDIPQRASRSTASFSSRPANGQNQHELYFYLRILVEAAVYGQKFWKGYFFPNARNKLKNFYDAHKLSQEGWLLPPHLTDYKRDWTHREVRLLQRAHLICDLLKQYEVGEVTDFGIIRAIRATFVGIPAQPSWCPEDLESFLYHRIADSGLTVSKIPEILVLHPEHDMVFANYRLRQHVISGLRERADQFEKEEVARLKEIDKSYMTFEEARKKEMTRWERMKKGLKKVFGKKEVVVLFDPFAPEHGLEEQREETV
ncbi:hypothetical protein BKA58DRAFT_425676 [Alternaria rosae]|uniref:uncharacterized protein n=1 Tax=Alternaria rosae TaxID=1187941 RepID=UPI001E8D330A|nr:uncharacterized protein BKA58DRAFT_425676 [Alternaria rosae]KAH6881952.1 hypothetical protein BKA58DRAFT_425676 [Alternaria rosae]